MGPGRFPRFSSAVKDGKPWVAHTTNKSSFFRFVFLGFSKKRKGFRGGWGWVGLSFEFLIF